MGIDGGTGGFVAPLGKWDQRWLATAGQVATFSRDPSSRVGAVIAQGKNFVSLGYNGFAAGVQDLPERLGCRNTRLAMTIHAEVNAIMAAMRNLHAEFHTIYCTHPPCSHCAAVIIQSGIKRVVYRSPSADLVDRWRESLALAQIMLEEAQVVTAEV